ncbi:hypothetical protein MHY85_17235, partial [Cellulomonas sp. ACRRI]|uniref:hypothetical protein n=1 Tax=Cellulomonas sp. ACRRI TaxID=2918188 RepID=UPI001EF1CEAE
MTAAEAPARDAGTPDDARAGGGRADGSPRPGGRRVLTLAQPPSLAGLYARAGLASGRAAVGAPVRRAVDRRRGGAAGEPGA